jgi:uncharacterized protein YbcI
MDPIDEASPTRGNSQSRQIADAIVHLTRRTTGRGPVRTRVIIDGDAVVVLMHDVLTKSEQALVDDGRTAVVLALRSAIQDLLRPAYSAEVERITGRKVATFLSTNTADPDRAADIFLLED